MELTTTTTERPPALDEQETTFTIEATDRKTVTVFSNDQVWQNRIEKLGVEAFRRNAYGRWYHLSLEEFNFGFRKKRQLSAEQRAISAERLAALRSARLADDDDGDDDNEDV